MKLLSGPDLQTIIRRFLPRGAWFFVWLCCILGLWGWPKALYAAPSAAPLAQANCFGIMNVGNTAELNNAIGCYNLQTTAGVYTIIFSTDITLTTASTIIDNTNPGLTLQILGSRYTLSGANTYRGLEINPNTEVMIDDLFIRAGKADTSGGGIRNSGTLSVRWSTLISNTAQIGGGIYNLGTGTLSLEQSKLSGNSVTLDGGGIYNQGTLLVDNSTFSGNTTMSGNGAGIYSQGPLTVTNSTLISNSAQVGGGGIQSNGKMAISNSTLSGNSAQNGGGAIISLGPLTVTNSTLSGNSTQTGFGDGIVNYDQLALRNTIIANSPNGEDCRHNGLGTIISQTHNLIESSGATACGITNGSNGSIIGQDPALAPLAFNNGSDLETHALLATSPAIDKGDAAICAAAPINNLDQNGVIRPIGAACDIGAVERIACSFPATVSTTAELNDAITCYGMQETAGVYTITFTSDITLTSETRSINNFNFGLALQINGNNKVLSGANKYRGLLIDGDAHVTITQLTIRDGKIGDDTGGGILNYGDLTLDNSQIISNSATTQNGGGIYNDGKLTVTNSRIISNSAQSNNDGGGIYNAGTLTVGNSQIINNGAKNGGGIYNAGLLDMTNSTFSGNSAFNGSGLYNNDTSSVSNSTLSGNLVSYGIGGTIFNTGTLTVTNSTLSANISGLGGYSGLYQSSSGKLALRNTIIGDNEVNDDCVNDGGTITSQTNNLIESSGATACGIANGANGSIIGQAPALAPLAFNGGSGPKTHALLAASPAIDKGDAATCAAAPINNLDQNGVIRPQGATCDIGAVEYVPPPAVCSFPATVSTTAELNNALSCYNSQTTAGVYTITFNADITLDITSTVINKPVPSIALQINGNNKVLRGDNKYRGFEITPNTRVTITKLTIISGKTDTSGGGILNYGTLTLNNSLLLSNSAPKGDGGGIYNAGSGTLTVNNSTFASNSALFRGGGIYNEGTLTVVGSFSGNSAESGGGIMNNKTVQVNFSTFSDNKATNDGGGLYNNIDSTLTISNSYVITNSGNKSGGGITNFGTLMVSNSTLSANKATTNGGGIMNAGPLTVSNSTFSGNSATGSGGGIMNAGPLTMSNSTISGNLSGNGGGLYNTNKGTLTVSNSTLSDNKATTSGGGILNGGALTLKNTIIANSAGGGDCVNEAGTITSQTNNLIESSGATACGINNSANSSIIGQDPALAPLGTGNGPQTHALLATSPAIDKGDAATCAAAPINNRDQNGVIRPQGAACDIGAVEYVSFNKVLTVSKAGNGSGAVTSTPAGITCGTTCNASFTQNAAVTLTATPDNGSTFAGWGGACSGTTATCTVTMDNAKTVTATFNKATVTADTQKIYLPTVSR